MEAEAKEHARARMAERITQESKTLPYRWGYFQGSLLVPLSLLILSGVASVLREHRPEAWYLTLIALFMGILGLPLAFGLLWKRRFALVLVYVMFGLSLLLLGIKVPTAIKHYRDAGDKGSAFFEAELMLVWLLSLIYYRRRKTQFH